MPSPRGSSWAVFALYGSPAKGTGILNNETYIGRYIWNRSQWIKNPDTGKRSRIDRPRSEWQIIDRPNIRIIDDATWLAVRRRIDTPRRAGGTKGKGAQLRTLFGGLMSCGYCGGAVIAVNARLYGCATRKDRGLPVCQGLYVPRRIMDARLLGIVRNDLLSPTALAAVQRRVNQILDEERREIASRIEAARHRLTELDREIENLVTAIAQYGMSDALQSRLPAAESERAALTTPRDQPIREGKITDIMPRYRSLLIDLKAALTRDIPKARTILKDYFKEIRLEERESGIYARIKEDQAGLLIAASRQLVSESGSGGRI